MTNQSFLCTKGYVKKLVILLFLSSITIIVSCKNNDNVKVDDSAYIRKISIMSCENILKRSNLSVHSRQKAKEALEKWKNEHLDSGPDLIQAKLVKSPKTQQYCLFLSMSDKNGDIAGIGIREEHSNDDHTITRIKEEYPLYLDAYTYKVLRVSSPIIPVSIRDKDQRKDTKLWEQYKQIGAVKEELMPPIWISIPDGEKTKVFMWLYDLSGHKSEEMEVETTIQGH